MFTSPARRRRVAAVAALLSAAAFAPPAFAEESVVDRSAFSTTVKSGDAFKTRTYPEQVNFEDASGDWKAIDRSLERQADGTVRPVAVDGDAVIPSTLTRPVVLEHDGRTVSFRLQGADAGADRDVAGSKASFDDALSGVDVSYKVRPTGLKELITLAGRSAQRSFNYEVRTDSDLAAKIVDGDLAFTDASGEERFRVAAPLAWDSAKLAQTANALTLSVTKTGDRAWRLTMRADDKWLDDPARVYPVTLDPDYYWIDGKLRFHGANQDCALAGGNQQNLKQCAYQNLQIGYGNSRPYKSVMKFDVASAIPAYARVTASRFLAWQFPSTQKFNVASRLRTVTSDWDNNSTWNNRKDGTPWTTAGGDVSTDPALTGDPITVGPSGYWSYWPAPIAAVSGWIKGTLPNYGFQVSTDLTTPTVKSAYEFTSTDGNQANWPALEVTWVPDATAPAPITASGAASADRTYLSGAATGTIIANATDDNAGIKQLDLYRNDAQAAANGIGCPSNTCPLTVSDQLPYNTTGWTEGAHVLKIRAVDAAGNQGFSAPWAVLVDRTAPAFYADDAGTTDPTTPDAATYGRDPVSGSTVLEWVPAEDPDLADGQEGSGVASYTVRYRVGTSWSAWTTVTQSSLTLPSGTTDITAAEISIRDAVGNTRPAQVIAVEPSGADCDPVENDPIAASLYTGYSGTDVLDEFTFNEPKRASEVMAGLPQGAQVVSVVERHPTDSRSQTSGMTVSSELGLDGSMAFWEAFLREDGSDFSAYLRKVRGGSSAGDRRVIDSQLNSLEDRTSTLDAFGGVPVRSFAIRHDEATRAVIQSRFDADLQRSAYITDQGTVSGEGCTEQPAPATSRSSATTAAAAIPPAHPTQEPQIVKGSYSPPYIRVNMNEKTQTIRGRSVRFARIAAAWKFSSAKNRAYWFKGPRAGDRKRGYEVQVNLNQDNRDGTYGTPPWGPTAANGNGTNQGGVPGVWTASYRYAYPDDYTSDNLYQGYGLTVGMAQPPRSNRFRYRWAHALTPGESRTDTASVTLQPLHYATSGHDQYGIEEPTYCRKRNSYGSCFFGDHGVALPSYGVTTTGSRTLRGPGQALFKRR